METFWFDGFSDYPEKTMSLLRTIETYAKGNPVSPGISIARSQCILAHKGLDRKTRESIEKALEETVRNSDDFFFYGASVLAESSKEVEQKLKEHMTSLSSPDLRLGASIAYTRGAAANNKTREKLEKLLLDKTLRPKERKLVNWELVRLLPYFPAAASSLLLKHFTEELSEDESVDDYLALTIAYMKNDTLSKTLWMKTSICSLFACASPDPISALSGTLTKMISDPGVFPSRKLTEKMRVIIDEYTNLQNIRSVDASLKERQTLASFVALADFIDELSENRYPKMESIILKFHMIGRSRFAFHPISIAYLLFKSNSIDVIGSYSHLIPKLFLFGGNSSETKTRDDLGNMRDSIRNIGLYYAAQF